MRQHGFWIFVLIAIFCLWISPAFAWQGSGDSGIYTVKKRHPGSDTQSRDTAVGDQSQHNDSIPTAAPNLQQHTYSTGGNSGAAQAQSQTTTSAAAQVGNFTMSAGSPDVVKRVLTRKFGSEGFQHLLTEMNTMKSQAATGKGAPASDVWFDGSALRTGNDDNARPAGTHFFQGSLSAAPVSGPAPTIRGASMPATVQDGKQRMSTYGSIPGGVVLEGVASGLNVVSNVRYDSRFNAFVLNDHAAYFVKVRPETLAVLCRAIAEDDKERIGVSLGQVQLVYGKLPDDSNVAWDLKMADHFLGDIVFATNDWTAGYRFADGFTPLPNEGQPRPIAIFFSFRGFSFGTSQDEVWLTQADFDAKLFPLVNTPSAEGGLLPDYDAIEKGQISDQYQTNARHLAEHIDYYRRERIVSLMFTYGETAAMLRKFKSDGFDLIDLASHILRN